MTEAGTGQYRYDFVEEWGTLPTGWSWGRVTGVAVDSRERVYVCQQLIDPPILVFDKDGSYLNSWGVGAIGEPHTIYVGSDDLLYLADRGDHVVSKLTLEGEPLVVMGNRGQPSDTGCNEDEAVVLRAGGPFNRPTRLSPSPTGDLYVSDGYRNCRVHRFSAEGELIRSWGTPGRTAPGEIYSPHCVWVDREGLLYLCDRNERPNPDLFAGRGFCHSMDRRTRRDRHLHRYRRDGLRLRKARRIRELDKHQRQAGQCARSLGLTQMPPDMGRLPRRHLYGELHFGGQVHQEAITNPV